MTDFNNIKQDSEKRMDGAISSLQHSLNGLRTGRASATLLDPIQVEVYGNRMPINQVATVSTPDARMISVQVWDKTNVPAVEKAILNSGLGLNPQTDDNIIRLPMPDLSEDRRKELAKKAKEYMENAKVAVRNVRRDSNDLIKKMEKNNEISEDEQHNYSDKIQKVTDDYIGRAENLTNEKIEEILQI